MSCMRTILITGFLFFNDTATTEIYTLSLHDALPIFVLVRSEPGKDRPIGQHGEREAERHDVAAADSLGERAEHEDRKSTRLNSSHQIISYAVFCLQKKSETKPTARPLQKGYPCCVQS